MLTDTIADMIEKMLKEGDGILELQRNDMAQRLGCVPSQISYVITSRFTPQRGYHIVSRRGGGGCIRIERVELTRDALLNHMFHTVEGGISEGEAIALTRLLLENGLLSEREHALVQSSLSENALRNLPETVREQVRSDLFQQILFTMMKG